MKQKRQLQQRLRKQRQPKEMMTNRTSHSLDWVRLASITQPLPHLSLNIAPVKLCTYVRKFTNAQPHNTHPPTHTQAHAHASARTHTHTNIHTYIHTIASLRTWLHVVITHCTNALFFSFVFSFVPLISFFLKVFSVDTWSVADFTSRYDRNGHTCGLLVRSLFAQILCTF